MNVASTSETVHGQFVVVGGGVAGICCVDELDSIITDNSKIILITGCGTYIKTVVNPQRLGQITETFEIEEKISDAYFSSEKVMSINQDVIGWNSSEKKLQLSNNTTVTYDKLCICTGGSARSTWKHPRVITIRDTETIESLKAKLQTARRVLLIGNGGIATELVFELKNIEILWAIRHSSISATYFDAAAARFFEPMLLQGRPTNTKKREAKIDRYIVDRKSLGDTNECDSENPKAKSNAAVSGGCALGPHWLAKLKQDEVTSPQEAERKVFVAYEVELNDIYDDPPTGKRESPLPDNFQKLFNWRTWAELSNGSIYGCDLIIEATGVVPNSNIWKRDCPELKIADDNGIFVGEKMDTNIPDVYAAGDVCTANWPPSPHWTQIRLWTQARQMGIYCARAMIFPDIQLDIAFELFTHATTFFGLKVILLGDFAAIKIEKPFQVFMRITELVEYVKVIIKNGRVHGAVLIGETDLEETLENLILNQTDISAIEDDFLNPQVDLEDYFD